MGNAIQQAMAERPAAAAQPAQPAGQGQVEGQPPPQEQRGKILRPHANIWQDGQPFELKVYVNEHELWQDDQVPEEHLIWHQQGLRYNWDPINERSDNVTIVPSPHVQNNGSLYAHVFIFKNSVRVPGSKSRPDPPRYKLHQLNYYKAKPKIDTRKNLVSGKYIDSRVEQEMAKASDQSTALQEARKELMKSEPVEIISFWRPSLTIRLVHDFTVFPYNGIPAQMAPYFDIDAAVGHYHPVLYFDYFWVLSERHNPINETVTELPLEVTYAPISMLKWQFQIQMEQSWKTQAEWGGTNDGDSEDFKRMLLDTNPWLLGLTMVVSLLHTVFDFLAFKNDIAFWKDNKDLKGLSVRTVFLNCGCQAVIFLYLLDNETSWLILFSSGIGLAIECWKIKKAADVSVEWKPNTLLPSIKITDKQSYLDSGTSTYDAEAMHYLSYALYPLVIGYSIYALYYNEYKSWYSWVISSLVGTVYTFGFIMMCPQLYLNYRLKSVAHLPWRMLTYKALNTFIDDLFAFIIKMPTMHRLACFRDDIIFFAYLYQRWVYRIDYTRANEFGLVPDEEKTRSEADVATKALPENGAVGTVGDTAGGTAGEGHSKVEESAAAGTTIEGTKIEPNPSSDSSSSSNLKKRNKPKKAE